MAKSRMREMQRYVYFKAEQEGNQTADDAGGFAGVLYAAMSSACERGSLIQRSNSVGDPWSCRGGLHLQRVIYFFQNSSLPCHAKRKPILVLCYDGIYDLFCV